MARVPPQDETVRLIWEGVIGVDRMSRYYGYLAHRLGRLGDLLAIGTVGCSAGTVMAVSSRLPEWMALVPLAAAAIAGIALVVGRYQEKAARSVDLYRQLERLSIEWERLWNGVWDGDDADLREEWERLSGKQAAILERAPVELPLSKSLALRSEREADQYWTQRYAPA